MSQQGFKAPAEKPLEAAAVHEQVAKRIANVRFTQFSRTELLLGKAAMERLAECRVAVFGIGGGCSEGEVIREAIKLIGTGTYKTYEIDLTGDVAESEGMVCGGIMRVLIEDEV